MPIDTDARVLNLEDFFGDIERTSAEYFQAVDSDVAFQLKLATRFDKVGTLDDVQLSSMGRDSPPNHFHEKS